MGNCRDYGDHKRIRVAEIEGGWMAPRIGSREHGGQRIC